MLCTAHSMNYIQTSASKINFRKIIEYLLKILKTRTFIRGKIQKIISHTLYLQRDTVLNFCLSIMVQHG